MNDTAADGSSTAQRARAIADAGGFDRHPGRGIAFQVDVEDAVGVLMQAKRLEDVVEEEL